MKKNILMFCFAALSFQIGNAQTDLQITGLIPVTNGVYDSIADYEIVPFFVVIKNNGPSNLGLTDTVFLDMDLDWLIVPQGYILRARHEASTLNCLFAGSSDTLGFNITQNVSLGQTPSGSAIPLVPNHEYLNDINFRVYGYTSTFNLLNDPGVILDGNGSIVTSGNNFFNPTNVIYGMQDTPVVTIGANVNNICVGSPVTFTANVTDPGSNPSYQWKVNNVNVGTNSPTFTSSALLNNDVITCIYISTINGFNTTVTSSAFTMSVSPVLIPTISLTANPGATVQAGTTVQFSTTITNGGSTPIYAWYKNQIVIPGQTSSTYSAIAELDFINGDQIYASLTSNASCVNPVLVSSSSLSLVTFGSPVVTITSDLNNVCAGTPVTFTASVTDPGLNPTYQWEVNSINVGSNSPTFTSSTLEDNDQVTCTYTSAVNGINLNVTSGPITMSVSPILVPTISLSVSPGTSVQTGTTVEFSTTILNGGSAPIYTWSKNNNVIPGATIPNYSAVAGTDFMDGDQINVTLTSSEPCANPDVVASSIFNMEVTPVSIESINGSKESLLTLSPNPNKGKFFLSANNLVKGTYSIKAVNSLGQIVFMKTLNINNSIQEEISISGLSSGTYYLILSNENGKVAASKFLIPN